MRRGAMAAVLAVLGGGCAVELGGRDDELASERYAAEAERRCYVAFVHGRGEDRTGWSQAQLETYWAPDADGDGASDPRYSLTAWAAEERGCRVFRLGYDGSAAFWSERAAGRVARDLAAWIDAEEIGPGELVLVGHSMGGLVVRWIVNQGVPGSAYFDQGGAPYARVAAVTRDAITIQAPHAGTEVADSLFGEADTWYARRVADVVDLFGIEEGDEAARYMRRVEMEYAGSSGGWMGDAARTIPLRTISGFSTFDGAGNWVRWMNEDYQLALVWGAICHRAHAINAYVCREDAGEAGDGLVEELSGAGYLMRDGAFEGRQWRAGRPIAGARVDWLRVEHNHHQGRFDWHAAEIRDRSSGTTTRAWLGSYVGDHIHTL